MEHKEIGMKEYKDLKIKYRMLNRTKYQSLLSIKPEGKIIIEQMERTEKTYQQEEDE